MTIFRLDYLSGFLTVVATILMGRKSWTGLVVSGVNSLIVCVIALHTSEYGFIPVEFVLHLRKRTQSSGMAKDSIERRKPKEEV